MSLPMGADLLAEDQGRIVDRIVYALSHEDVGQ